MIKTVFEDPNILVIEKPAGLVSDFDPNQKTLVDILKNEFKISLERGGLVHRLDKDTSGLMVVAKTEIALLNLQEQFKERKVKKEYLALVHGRVDKGGLINISITRNPKVHDKFTVTDADEEGRLSATQYEPSANYQLPQTSYPTIFSDVNKIEIRKLAKMNYGQFSLLKCFPLTGRTHQIRVHLKHINHPIVSDGDYVGRKTYRLDIKWCPRQFLHAAKLGFYHPESGEWVQFESKLSPDLAEVLNLLTIDS